MITVIPAFPRRLTARAMAALDQQVAAANDPELSAAVAADCPQSSGSCVAGRPDSWLRVCLR